MRSMSVSVVDVGAGDRGEFGDGGAAGSSPPFSSPSTMGASAGVSDPRLPTRPLMEPRVEKDAWRRPWPKRPMATG